MSGVSGLDAHSLAILLHILLLTYWLGADLGVFYSSRFITNSTVPLAGRTVATKVMHAVDMAPRICLVLFLPSGVTLMALDKYGENIFSGWLLALAWVGGLAWLALVILDYRRRPERFADLVRRVDFVVRVALVIGLIGVSVYTFVVAEPFGVTTNPKWLAGKVCAYALCILGGLMIRVKLRPFGPALAQLSSSGSTPEVETAIRTSVRGTLPYVYLIWAMVVVAAFLGVVKPGAAVH